MKTHYQQTKQIGFSIIEVLVALFLLSIVLLGVEEQMLKSLQSSQEALNQTIAIEQLNGMASMIALFPGQYQNFLSEWNEDNQNFFLNGNGEIKTNTSEMKIRITWRSGSSQVWQCDSSRQLDMSCIELLVAP